MASMQPPAGHVSDFAAASSGDELRLFILAATAVLLMNGAFVIEVGDVWTRVVVAISILGVIGFLAIPREQRNVMTPRIGALPLGVLLGLLSYAAAWLVSHFEPLRQEMLRVSLWPAAHSSVTVVTSATVAVLGEEIFWRGAILSLLLRRFRPTVAVLLACAIFATAHLGSDTWLIPLSSFGVVLLWNVLFLYTKNLTAPFVCHLLFDLLILRIAPPV
jgi:membrane protease YdiL (CAAX protease family)